MKILHVIPTLDPRAGGPPLVTSELAAAQAVLGHDVHIMTYQSRQEGASAIAAENKNVVGFNRITQHLLPFINWPERILGIDALDMAGKLVPQMDAVHLHGVWEPQLHHTASAARKFGKPYLVLLHGMLLPWAMRRGVWKKRLVMKIGARHMLSRGTLQFLSKDEEAATRSLGFANPGVVIPNGTMAANETNLPPIGTMRKDYPQLGEDPYILFLGRLHEQKGIDLLIPAFQIVLNRVPSARLVIAGPDYGRSAEMQAKVNTLGMHDRVHWIGPIYGAKKIAAIREASCFCLPSRHEGFSLAILESLAYGTPVVISPECHFPEVADAGAGLIAELEPSAIAESLCKMLDDPNFCQNAARAAKQLIADRYTWPTIAQQMIEAYTLF